jgi:hypothetical protein
MAIPKEELERATRSLQVYCDDIPDHARGRIRHGFRIEGSAIVLFSSYPSFQRDGSWVEEPIAKFRYFASRKEWHLFWMDRHLKWRTYDWLAPKRTFAPLLREVERDPTCLFWG